MAIETKCGDISRIENPRFVALYLNDMVNVQRGFVSDMLAESTVGAGEVIALEYGESEFGISLVSSLAPLLGSELRGESHEIEIGCEPVRALLGVVVPMTFAARSLASVGGIRVLGQPTVPRGFPELELAAVGVMASFELGNSNAATALVYGESRKSLSAPACAKDFDSGSLKFGSAHVVPSYHKQVN